MKKIFSVLLFFACCFLTISCSKNKINSLKYRPVGDYKFPEPSTEYWTLSTDNVQENATGIEGFSITPKYTYISKDSTSSIVISTAQCDEKIVDEKSITLENSINTYTELLKSSLEKNGTCKIEKETLENGMNYRIVANIQDMIFLKVIYYVYDFNALSVDFLLPASEYMQYQTDIVTLLDSVALK